MEQFVEKQLLICNVKPMTKTEHAEWSLKGTGKLDFTKDINSADASRNCLGGP